MTRKDVVYVRSRDLPGEDPDDLRGPYAEVRLAFPRGQASAALRLLCRVVLEAICEARRRS